MVRGSGRRSYRCRCGGEFAQLPGRTRGVPGKRATEGSGRGARSHEFRIAVTSRFVRSSRSYTKHMFPRRYVGTVEAAGFKSGVQLHELTLRPFGRRLVRATALSSGSYADEE
jgi:hypothetical protein